MAINTLITLKDALTAWAVGHGQLQGRIFFEADDHREPIITTSDSFPIMFVAPLDVTVGRAMNTHTLRIYIYERINDDREDVWENANDTSLILRDIRVWWNDHGIDDINIIDDPVGIFGSDKELDKLVGYFADIRFEIPSHGRCAVPVNTTPSPVPTCEPVEYLITDTAENELYSGSIESGGELNQPIQDSTVSNSDNSYTASILAEGNLELPDVTIIDSDGTPVQHPAVKDFTCEPQRPPDEYELTVNGNEFITISDNTDIPVLNSDQETVGTVNGGAIDIGDSTVQNSDSSYSVGVPSEDGLTLPDSTVNVNSVNEGSVVSVKTIDVNINDGTNPVTPDNVTVVGNTVTVSVPPQVSRTTAKLMKTGQTTSYRTGDDGDDERGRGTSFLVLAENNPFGNTNRFTSELGTQTYTNNIVIDWSTFDGSTVLGWYKVVFASATGHWNEHIDRAVALSVGAFTSGWRLPNYPTEMGSIFNIETTTTRLNYAPFNDSTATNFWTGSTPKADTTQAYYFLSGSGISSILAKTGAGSMRSMAVRVFTVTGTTLT